MVELHAIHAESKTELYTLLAQQLRALLEGERNLVANAANAAALLFHTLPDLNWAGFYFLDDGELVLGPFQGKPACVRIPLGRGVCGTAAAEQRSQVVADVYQFPGHIACDADSRSELVVPVINHGELLGVLDLDSPHTGRFDDDDRAGLEQIVGVFVAALSS
ncbi:MAG: GAF domain-containing protein [Chlorobi bacterium]|nr:MAG: GAF domain-containing protein [Chlorobi bacterium OLB7]MBK8911150.1 GAF domain-containing protein [Chlorobiota bacterium]MCE7933169.1 GAF domain-containing protein [Chlorobi bacterium CHB2]